MSKEKLNYLIARMERRLAVMAAVLLLVGVAAGMGIGMAVERDLSYKLNPPTLPVNEVYTVKPGDSFWAISQSYRDKDARNPYIFTYQDELRKLNPDLVTYQNQLTPGQKLHIIYYQLIPRD